MTSDVYLQIVHGHAKDLLMGTYTCVGAPDSQDRQAIDSVRWDDARAFSSSSNTR